MSFKLEFLYGDEYLVDDEEADPYGLEEPHRAEFDTKAEREAFLQGAELAPYFRWRQRDPGGDWSDWL